MRISPKTKIFENLVPSWWCYLGMFRRHDLAGESVSMPLGLTLRFQSHASPPVCSLCFPTCCPASVIAAMLVCCYGALSGWWLTHPCGNCKPK